METVWACEQCGEDLDEKPSQCPECGYAVFSQQTRSTSSVKAPEPMDPSKNRSPSQQTREQEQITTFDTEDLNTEGPNNSSTGNRARSVIRSLAYKARAWVKAPFLLLKHYLLPILAFLLVFGGFAYLVL